MIQPVKVKSFTIKPSMAVVLNGSADMKADELPVSVANILEASASAAEKSFNQFYSRIRLTRVGFELHGSLAEPITLAKTSNYVCDPMSFVHGVARPIFDEWLGVDVYLQSLVLSLNLVLDDDLRQLQIKHARDCGKFAVLRPVNQASVSFLVKPHKGFNMGDGEDLIPLLLYHGPNYSWYEDDEWELSDSAPFCTPHIHLPEGLGEDLDITLRVHQ